MQNRNLPINLQDSNICCLVPELCNLTGLTEKMKCDYKIMNTLNEHTMVTPEKRLHALIDLINCINGMKMLYAYIYIFFY